MNLRLFKISYFIVGAFLTGILAFLAFRKGGLILGSILTILLLYDVMAALNEYSGDTISEVIVLLSSHPLVPWIFGGVSVWMIETKFLIDPYLLGAWFLLQGHFFFPLNRKK